MNVSLLTSFLGEFSWFVLATGAIDHDVYATPLYCALIAVQRDFGNDHPALVFYSSAASTHGLHLGCGPTSVAGGMGNPGHDVASIRGAQFRGTCLRGDALSPKITSELAGLYLQRFPQATGLVRSSAAHHLYLLTIQWLKLTDNRLGFGVHPIHHFARLDQADLDRAHFSICTPHA